MFVDEMTANVKWCFWFMNFLITWLIFNWRCLSKIMIYDQVLERLRCRQFLNDDSCFSLNRTLMSYPVWRIFISSHSGTGRSRTSAMCRIERRRGFCWCSCWYGSRAFLSAWRRSLDGRTTSSTIASTSNTSVSLARRSATRSVSVNGARFLEIRNGARFLEIGADIFIKIWCKPQTKKWKARRQQCCHLRDKQNSAR